MFLEANGARCPEEPKMYAIPHTRRPEACTVPAPAGPSPREPRSEASSDAFLASGSSPTIHLLGAGKVGQSFLELGDELGLRVVSVTDRSGTLYRREGLPACALAHAKRGGGRVADFEDAAALPLETALEVVDADIVVDCLPSELSTRAAAAERVRSLLASGKRVALAAKSALLHDTRALLRPEWRERLGIAAVLGGTGRRLLLELEELRQRTVRIHCVPNATTTLLLEGLRGGEDLEAALARARDAGVLESDPEQDLDGRDAALKLAIVASAVFDRPVSLEQVERSDLRKQLDRRDLGSEPSRTTRLIGRAARDRAPCLAFESLPCSDRFAIPWQQVAYGYEFDDGSLRLHVGRGVGPEPTARAVLEDVLAFVDAQKHAREAGR